MAEHNYKFNVTMSCGGCSGAIERVLKKLEGESFNLPFIIYLECSNRLPILLQASSPTMSLSKPRLPTSSPKRVWTTTLCLRRSPRLARRSTLVKQMERQCPSKWLLLHRPEDDTYEGTFMYFTDFIALKYSKIHEPSYHT